MPRKSKGDSSHKLLKLMLVCKYFNQIIQITPAFWTELWLVRTIRNTEEQEAGWIEWIGEHIKKSKELPLRVFFILSTSSLTKIYPILLPTSPRWVHLSITSVLLIFRPAKGPSTLQPLFDAPIPQLRSLSVEGLGKWVDAVSGIGTVFRHAPRLTRLEWHDRLVVFRPESGATGSSEEHVQWQSTQGVTYDFAQKTLEVLSIKGAIIPIPFECMVMHRLRLLTLGGFCRPWPFLERWQFPVLEELHISADPYDEVKGLATPTFPTLKKIQWLDTESKPAPADPLNDRFLLLKVLAASSELQAFCISCRIPNIQAYLNLRRIHRQPADRILPFLATDDVTGAPKYCPNLQELCLQEASFGELKHLADIRPQLEKVEVVALRGDSDSASPSREEDLARLEILKERVEVRFHDWVWPYSDNQDR
ncbi:hypothetical protein M407DRAFT_24939 [Tulasnella calospora MUT 4182]|uniref:F-box domain-containing protein n=1 Tax=Tulasnella calospora MUT 4182 TaxID=1051891 RepID=A0A0C3LWQ2_9AGAM|nr:hypothetical protein M407DRAFT_24939 [Tulasnella calospora MUT 4182]